jgi:hypothetical protein
MFQTSSYLIVMCLVGVEEILTQEILKNHPQLTRGFFRRGVVTFKGNDFIFDEHFKLNSCLHREVFLGFGDWKNVTETHGHISSMVVREMFAPGKAPRSKDVQGKDQNKVEVGEAESLEEKILGIWREKQVCHPEGKLTLIIFDEKQAFVGRYLQGNDPKVMLPKKAPSRAYLKFAQAFQLTSLDQCLKNKTSILELGCVPGGASYYFLENGAYVWGVDPAEMNGDFLNEWSQQFKHLKFSAQNYHEVFHCLNSNLNTNSNINSSKNMSVNRKTLHFPKIDIIVNDMNLSPKQSLSILYEYASNIRPTYLVFTMKIVKLNEYAYFESYLEDLKRLGYKNVILNRMIKYCHREIMVVMKKIFI